MQVTTAAMIAHLNHLPSYQNSEVDGSVGENHSLEESFETQIKARYGYDTKLGGFLFALLALIHLKCPSTYLASRSRDALEQYRDTAPELRAKLIHLQMHVRRGNIVADSEEGHALALPNGTRLFLRLAIQPHDDGLLIDEFDPDPHKRYVSIKVGERGDWIELPITLASLMQKIEDDIVHNDHHFDPKLVASCKLSNACQAVDKVSLKGIIDEATGMPKIDPTTGQHEYMEPDVLNLRLLNPAGDADVQAIHDDLQNIAENLAACGQYDDVLHPSSEAEANLTLRLYVVVKLFISEKIGQILRGDNNLEIQKALDLIDTIPPAHLDSLFRGIKNGMEFCQEFTGLSLRAVVNLNGGNLVRQCVEAVLTDPTYKTRGDFFKLAEVVNRIPVQFHEFDDLRMLVSDCFDQLHDKDDKDIDRLEFED